PAPVTAELDIDTVGPRGPERVAVVAGLRGLALDRDLVELVQRLRVLGGRQLPGGCARGGLRNLTVGGGLRGQHYVTGVGVDPGGSPGGGFLAGRTGGVAAQGRAEVGVVAADDQCPCGKDGRDAGEAAAGGGTHQSSPLVGCYSDRLIMPTPARCCGPAR